jgi:hypothetical protein
LLELTEDTVTLPPLAVRLPLWDPAVPIVTLPKLIETGVTPTVPLEVVAVPDRDTETDESDAVELIESVAVSVPVVLGVNVTDKLALAPAARV